MRSRAVYALPPGRVSIVHARAAHKTVAAALPPKVSIMLDVIFLIGGAALFALLAAYVAACDRL